MNIVHVANGDYDRYEELLLQKDQLEKEAFEYQMEYTRQFGDLTLESFQLKVDCISLKKSIAFCIAAKNRGEEADRAKLQEYLAKQMAAYKEELERMITEHDASLKGKPCPSTKSVRLKKSTAALPKSFTRT